MEFTSDLGDPSARYTIVGSIFFNDDVIGVLDGTYVIGSVVRKSVTSVRSELRPSCKHPVVAAVVGALMIIAPVENFAGDPLGLAWLMMGSLTAGVFLFCCGCYLLWGVMRQRDEPWIVFITETGERAFPLKQALTPRAMDLLAAACADETGESMSQLQRELAAEQA